MQQKKYEIEYTYSSRNDIRKIKEDILEYFKYREMGEDFMRKMKEAAGRIKMQPAAQEMTGFEHKGYDIYIRPYRAYLIFYIIDEENAMITILRILQDGMNWQFIIKQWLAQKDKKI